MEKLDLYDLRILKELQDDAGLRTPELARRVGLSTSPCWRRVHRLTESGVLQQVAKVDREKLGLGFVVYASIKLIRIDSDSLRAFERAVARHDAIVLCEMMAGQADYLLKIVTTDVRAYDDFLRNILLASGLVQDIQSRIVVRTVKDTHRVPLPLTPTD